jgi:hypothetical protein
VSLGTPLAKSFKWAIGTVQNPVLSLPEGAPVGAKVLVVMGIHANTAAGGDYTLAKPDAFGDFSGANVVTSVLGGTRRVYLWEKTIEEGDASWTFYGSGPPPVRVAHVIVFPGATGFGTPLLFGSGSNEFDRVAPGITTGADASYLVCGWTSDPVRDSGPGFPSGMTQIARTWQGGSGVFEPSALGTAYELRATAGATGDRTITESIENDYCSFSVEVLESLAAVETDMTETIVVDYFVGAARAQFPESVSPALQALRDPQARPVWLVTAQPIDRSTGERTTVRAATGAYNTDTAEGESPDVRFPAIVEGEQQPFELQRVAFEGNRIGGFAAPSIGNVPLASPIDRTGASALREMFAYDWHDGPLEIALAGYTRHHQRIRFEDREVAFVGRTAALSGTHGRVSIRAADLALRFGRPVQRLRFAGTGGLEGGPELKGQRKPMVLGYRRHLEPKLVDRQNRKWVYSVDYAGGECTLHSVLVGANAFPADNFTPFFEDGVNGFVLDTAYEGRVTCIASGPTAAGETSLSILQYAMKDLGGPFTADELDLVAFAIAGAELPGRAGIAIIEDNLTYRDLIARALGPAGLPVIDRRGRFAPRFWPNPIYDASDGTAPRPLSIERLAAEPPRQLIRIAYDVNYAQLSEDQLETAAQDTEFGRYAREEYLLAERSAGDPTEIAQEVGDPRPWLTLLVDSEDAEAYADRVWEYEQRPWEEYLATFPAEAFFWELGQIRTITHPDYDLAGGKACVIKSLGLEGDLIKVHLWRYSAPGHLEFMTGDTFRLMSGARLELVR